MVGFKQQVETKQNKWFCGKMGLGGYAMSLGESKLGGETLALSPLSFSPLFYPYSLTPYTYTYTNTYTYAYTKMAAYAEIHK